MLSYESENGTIFHHNFDFSGDIIMIVKTGAERKEIHINGDDILEFVANQYIMRECISGIEETPWRELLVARIDKQ